METGTFKRISAFSLAVLVTLTLAACMLSPGKFISNLDLRKDGQFAFSYRGEIYLLALTKLAEMGRKPGDATFEPEPCFNRKGAERTCTPSEIVAQKEGWEAEQQASAEKSKKDAEEMKPFLGGIDPSDPKAAEELAARLRKQAGWQSVVYKGDGLFEVDFAISGKLDHDFTFPTIERFPMANAFVQLALHSDGTVRIDAPAFGAGASGNPFMQLAQMSAMERAMDNKSEKKDMPKIPQLDGQFTLTTNGQILANNTDEGPKADPAGQRLGWTVNVRTNSAPTALIKLVN